MEEKEHAVDAALSVADEIRALGKAPPLTDEQKAQRKVEHEIFCWEQKLQAEERQLEYKRRQAEIAAVAEREAAIARVQEQDRRRREMNERHRQQAKDADLAMLKVQVRQQSWWQQSVERAAQNAVAYQARQTIINELEAMLTPPPPQPEPEVVYVSGDEYGSPNIADENYNPGYWLQKPIFRR